MISIIPMVNAQFKKIGGGLALSSGFQFHNVSNDYNKSGIIAVSLKSIYELNLPVHISPSFTIFYPNITKGQDDKTNVSSIMFDINGHYLFNSQDKLEFYGLAGLDFLISWKKLTFENNIVSSPTITEMDNAMGLNLGAGTYMKISGQFDIYGEVKYILSKYDQFMLNVGILIKIGRDKKQE